MNNLKQKSGTGKAASEVKPYLLGKLVDANNSEKNQSKILGLFNRSNKKFKDKFKYGVLSLKIMERDKSLF